MILERLMAKTDLEFVIVLSKDVLEDLPIFCQIEQFLLTAYLVFAIISHDTDGLLFDLSVKGIDRRHTLPLPHYPHKPLTTGEHNLANRQRVLGPHETA